jgi:hypothetical protein
MLNLLALTLRNNNSMGKGNGCVINMIDLIRLIAYVRGRGKWMQERFLVRERTVDFSEFGVPKLGGARGTVVARADPTLKIHTNFSGPYFPLSHSHSHHLQ